MKGEYSYQIRDILGKPILEDNISNGRTKIEINNISKGVYYIVIFHSNSIEIYNKKVIKL